MRRFRLVATSATLLTLIAAATPAGAKKPLPAQCPDGRFLVQGTPLIAGASTPVLEAVTLGTSVEITTGCGAVTAKVTRTRKGTVLKGAWPSCSGLAGKVKLKALVAAPDCTTMTGALTVSKAKPKKHPFTALRSVCGDHVVDPDADGEECDGPGTCAVASDTCSDQCRCASGSTTTSSTIAGGTTSTSMSTIPLPTTTITTTTVTTTITQPTFSTTSVTTTTTSTSTTSSTIVNAPPALVELNEIAPNQAGNHDLIELRVASGGTCKGITIEQAGFSTLILLATLPDVVVATDDLIVVHLNPLSGAGNPPTSENSGKAEFPAATFLANYDGAWDFLGSPSGIAFSTRVLQVRNALGQLVDALPATRDPYNPPSGFLAALQAVQTAGVWLPADCGGSPCTDATTPAAKDIIVDWEGASGTLATDNTVARHAGAHTHQASDWATGPSTMGAPNP